MLRILAHIEITMRQGKNFIPRDPVTGPLTLVLLLEAQTEGRGFHK